MRLLEANADSSFSLHPFVGTKIPSYAILSHTWEADNQEVTYQDLVSGVGNNKAGYQKIRFCGEQAKKDGLRYFWVDSCCIDKSSSAELQEAINSMFRWYQDAAKCYVYLSDVSAGKRSHLSEPQWESTFRRSRWFTRGWTLQELLAPRSVEFFSRDEKRLGDKLSLELQLYKATGIAIQALQGSPLSQFSDEERRSWAAKRQTTIEEDQVYCLLGIFNVYLPLIYGEGKKNALRRLQDEIDKLSLNMQVNLSQEERKCLQALRTSDYEQFKDRNPGRLNGTCKWFLQHDRFKEWQQSSSSSLLWVSADPGCGKSVLAKSLIDQEIKSTGSRSTCYFFFKDDNDNQKSSTTALSSLLHQLFSQKQSLIRHAIQDYKTEGNHLPHLFHKLWNILIIATSDPKAGEVVCILDALDECAEAERYKIIDTLSTFYKQSQSTSQLKFLVTSRPYFDIERKFASLIQHFPTIRLHGEKESESISREINLVIDARVQDLMGDFTANDQQRISEHLKSKKNSTYLWLHLIFDIIEQGSGEYDRRSDVEDLLSDLPSQVSDAYEKILNRTKNPTRTEILLEIVLAAEHPLTLDEADIALTLALQKQEIASHGTLDSERWTRDQFKNTVKSLCGLLINVYDSKLSFIHQTAREFLTHREQRGIWQGRLNMPKSHSTMSRSCISYMLLPDIPKDAVYKLTKDLHYPYLTYAAANWPLHYVSQGAAAASQCRKDARTLCNLAGPQARLWVDDYRGRAPIPFYSYYEGWTDLALASYLGLKPVVEEILLENVDVNAQCIKYGTALQAASDGGHKEIVKMLLDKGANVNARDGKHGTALQMALVRVHRDVVQVLLDGGADVNLEGGYYGSALQAACLGGCADLVQVLVDKGADVNINGHHHEQGCNPLWGSCLVIASTNGHKETVQVLLNNGADVNMLDRSYGTALERASSKGHKEVVRMLLGKGADVNLEGGKYNTALQAASRSGYKEIVRMLLAHGANVNLRGGEHETALLAASIGSHTDIVRTLLDKGANINIQGRFYGTVLQAACYSGDKDVVQMLLDKGADFNFQSGVHNTPLLAASCEGRKEVVQLLLNKGANVNVQGGQYNTALQAASGGGHTQIVQMLLDNGADVNLQNGFSGRASLVRKSSTALEAAARKGHKEIVQMLLDKGANINMIGSALQDASSRGYTEAVKMLLDNGSNVDFQGKEGGSALQGASSGGYKEIVQMLLEKGANVNLKGGDSGSALQGASSGGYTEIVQILLDNGAHVDVRGGKDGSALQGASSGGYKEIVQLLLEKGTNVNLQGGEYGTALQAASGGRGERSQRLMRNRSIGDKKAPELASDGDYNEIVQMLLDKGADPNIQGGQYGTAMEAALWYNPDTVKVLLDNGADVNTKDKTYGTILQHAALGGHTELVQILLDKGADVNLQGGHFGTALHAASFRGYKEIVRMLLDKGADFKIESRRYGTAIQAASGEDHKEVVEILLDMGAVNTSREKKPWWRC